MLTTLLLAAPLLAQGTPSVHTVLESGDVLSNGSTVLGFIDSALSDTGSWAAVVNTSDGYAVVQDGALRLAVGGTFQGELVTGISQVELSRDGVLGAVYTAADASGGTGVRLRIGPDTVLESGDPLPGPIGITGTVSGISGFDFEGTGASVAVRHVGAAGVGRALLVGSIAGGTFVPVGGWKDGDPISGLTRGYDDLDGSLCYSPSNGFAASVVLDGTPSGEHGVVRDGAGVAEQGGPGFAPNSTWTFNGSPRVAINDQNGFIVSGTIELSNGNDVGAIFNGTTPVAIEGGVPNGLIGDPVAAFEQAAVQLTDGGEPIFVLPFSSGKERLMAGAETLIVTGLTGSSGETITGLFAASQGGRLAASSDGETIIVSGRIGSDNALFLVERSVGAPVMCPAAPNSTGVAGALDAIGSGFVAINDLTLRATSLPPQQFSLLVTSQNIGFTPNLGGSQGNLCLGIGIGRFNDLLGPTDASGEISFAVDLTALPTPNALVAASAGETWVFQAWHRDVVGGAQTSNLTAAVQVEMR